jgi:PEP-CTERM motif
VIAEKLKDQSMKKISLMLALAGSFTLPLISHAQFAGNVVSYNSGTGFAAGFTNATAALGAPASGAAVTPFAPPFSKSQLVSIGAGGEITLQLNTPFAHNPSNPYGIDFNIFANEFFVSSGGNVSGLFYHTASTLVQVSTDGSDWFTLNPSLAPQVGELFPTDGNGNPFIPVDPSLTLASFTGDNLAGIRSLYNGSAGGTGYDLAWAQDANGNSVTLAGVDFIRIEVGSGVVDLDAIAAVPEPASWALLVTGLLLLSWHRRAATNLHRQ